MRAFAVLFLLSTLLTGCGSEPKKPEPAAPPVAVAPEAPVKTQPITAKLNITVSELANPDINGRASPIVIRVYELKSLGKFEAADFDKLADNADAALGPELTGSEQYHVKPGEVKTLKRTLSAETRYLAVSAGYRDLNQALWKDTLQLSDEPTAELLLLVDKLSVSLWKK